MLLTGRIKLVEKEGGKEDVVIEDGTKQAQTCSAEQKQKIKELITAYVKTGPALASTSPLPPPGNRLSGSPCGDRRGRSHGPDVGSQAKQPFPSPLRRACAAFG